eukprot:CAMPEP_0118652568 /NCGR_PEP_ID=MMETSP0785-20121206/11385_1 /TAXON_ID=91992 /ORGANISM="Bolidomonas pacifica, Strain CCMP 1866" /LENGTH=266 /DNA_ID=CAMNT_0006545089 /DNA_START=134 /DNA_END=934 /DNA_ORIENTATION=-
MSAPPMKKQKTSSTPSIILIPIGGSFGKLGEKSQASLDALATSPSITVAPLVKRNYKEPDLKKTIPPPPNEPGFPKLLRGGNGVTPKVLLHTTTAMLDTCAANPDDSVYFYTTSFGGRAAIHTILQRFEDKKKAAEEPHPLMAGPVLDASGLPREGISFPVDLPSNFAGIVSCGYPLYGPVRQDLLRSLSDHPRKHNLKLCFVVGDKDKDAPNLVDDMKAIIEDIGGNAKVVHVEGGKHSCFDVTGKDKDQIVAAAVEEIREFLLK